MGEVGFFGGFLFDGQTWTEVDIDDVVAPGGGPWLHVDIHDSDFAAVTYRPAGPGTGVAFLGFTPRVYFENPAASPPTDVHREAAGLAAWWAARRDAVTGADLAAKAAAVLLYLAKDDEDDEPADDSPFVEDKTDRFLTALGLPPFQPPA
ncbi:hypothetical protein [Dactylosporangium sp. NPDC005555]|uniref:hypothetical protein n=1 Tax=Dactylosporangium sp. NPDC005555 TaxID=3154889 RepID=UPI0033BDF5E4